MPPRLPPAALCLLLGLAPASGAAAGLFNVRDYGAVPDGRTKSTAAFARAVAACAAAGGGTVCVPAGRYLTGSIRLESNLTLEVEAGAELLYSGDPADSPLVPTRWEGTNVFGHAPLLYADGRENVTITGRGTLNGQGENWWWRNTQRDPARVAEALPARRAWLALYARIEAGEKPAAADFALAADYLRPSLIVTRECRNVTVEGVTITNSPMWMLHPLYSENVVVHGVTFLSDGPNGDGIDVNSCRNVRISDCFFNTGDDCIVIKSGRDNDGRRTARPTEYVTITNCVMYQGHGAVVIGSETAGGVRDVAASNIVAKGTDCGVRIKSMRGRGGVLENFRFDNWVIEDAQKQAFEITLEYAASEPEPLSERTPLFRNFAYSNITVVRARQVASIVGLPERAIEDLRFTDVAATGTAGFVCDRAAGVELRHVRVDADGESPFVFRDSRDLVLDDIGTRRPPAGAPVVRMQDSDDVWLRASRAAAGTATFLQFDGRKPERVRLTDNDLSAASVAVTPAGL